MLQHHVGGFAEYLDTVIKETFQNWAQTVLQRLTTSASRDGIASCGVACNSEVHDYCSGSGVIQYVYYMCRNTSKDNFSGDIPVPE